MNGTDKRTINYGFIILYVVFFLLLHLAFAFLHSTELETRYSAISFGRLVLLILPFVFAVRKCGFRRLAARFFGLTTKYWIFYAAYIVIMYLISDNTESFASLEGGIYISLPFGMIFSPEITPPALMLTVWIDQIVHSFASVLFFAALLPLSILSLRR